jgi:hypothetical protein
MSETQKHCPQCNEKDIEIICTMCGSKACHKCSFECPKCKKDVCYNCESCSCDDECVIHQFQNGICFYCSHRCIHKVDKNGFCLECLEFINLYSHKVTPLSH